MPAAFCARASKPMSRITRDFFCSRRKARREKSRRGSRNADGRHQSSSASPTSRALFSARWAHSRDWEGILRRSNRVRSKASRGSTPSTSISSESSTTRTSRAPSTASASSPKWSASSGRTQHGGDNIRESVIYVTLFVASRGQSFVRKEPLMRFRPVVFVCAVVFATCAFAKDAYLSIGGSVGAFRTDMRLFNPSSSKDIQVQAYYLPVGPANDNSGVQPVAVTVPKRQMLNSDNVVSILFP